VETEIIQAELSQIQLHYSIYRLHNEALVKKMSQSMLANGQMQPVLLQKFETHYRLIDGFKRFHAQQMLKGTSLVGKVLALNDMECKVLIYTSNKNNHSLADYEEAMLINSLGQENGLDQIHISRLLGKSRSWVSRRLSLIERLEPRLLDEIKLGVITTSHARELIKLPRGNQEKVCKVIINKSFTSRQSHILIKHYLDANTTDQQTYILENAEQIVARQGDENGYDIRLSEQGNRLLKAIRVILTAQNILTGNLTRDKISLLKPQDINLLNPNLHEVKEKTITIKEQIEYFQDIQIKKNN